MMDNSENGGSRQLRSYIAPGAPATRTPCDGSEPALRIEFGFTPRWYHERLGIDFSERWHLDPLYRGETVTAMRRELARRFPGICFSSAGAHEIPATLDGVHGAMTMPMIFGVQAEYFPDNWPAAGHADRSPAEIAALEAPASLQEVPVVAQLLEQMDVIEREFGRIEGYLNWQGVLNTAYRLRGPEILTDVLTDPGLARHLFDVVTRTMIDGMRLVYARQRKSGVNVRHATVSNCLVNMVSPAIYREFLLPCDARIASAFDTFGIHNCAWNVDPYIEDYATIHPLGYVDMGLESNLARAREHCPGARRALMYTPMDLANKPMDVICEDLHRIHRELGPCDVVMADIDHETPDQRIKDIDALAGMIVWE